MDIVILEDIIQNNSLKIISWKPIHKNISINNLSINMNQKIQGPVVHGLCVPIIILSCGAHILGIRGSTANFA
jgi:hypothetical protein